MAAWRREFLQRFPQYQAEAQDAISAGALMPRPLFFILRDALDEGNLETARSVVSYSIWLIKTRRYALALQEDLLGEITTSRRLDDFLRCLKPEEFEVIKEYCVIGWWPATKRRERIEALERVFAIQASRFKDHRQPE